MKIIENRTIIRGYFRFIYTRRTGRSTLETTEINYGEN